MSDSAPMTSVESLEPRIDSLSRAAARQGQGGSVDFLEEDADLKPGFIASIARGRTNLAQGRLRVREINEGE
jgi:hypothetical protein